MRGDYGREWATVQDRTLLNEWREDAGVDFVREILMPRGKAGRLVGDATAYLFPVAEAVNFAQTWLEVRSESCEQSENAQL